MILQIKYFIDPALRQTVTLLHRGRIHKHRSLQKANWGLKK